MSAEDLLHPQQFYRGGVRDKSPGDTIDPGLSGATHDISVPGHAYFTTSPDAAMSYAKLAQQKHGGTPQVYEVKPTGHYVEDDAHYGKGFGYMSRDPLTVIGRHS